MLSLIHFYLSILYFEVNRVNLDIPTSGEGTNIIKLFVSTTLYDLAKTNEYRKRANIIKLFMATQGNVGCVRMGLFRELCIYPIFRKERHKKEEMQINN